MANLSNASQQSVQPTIVTPIESSPPPPPPPPPSQGVSPIMASNDQSTAKLSPVPAPAAFTPKEIQATADPASAQKTFDPVTPINNFAADRMSAVVSDREPVSKQGLPGGTQVANAQGSSGGSELPSLMAAIRRQESGSFDGRYNAKAPGGSASGAYGFINDTWRRSAKAAGVNTNQYPTARSAPAAVQDKVMGHYFGKLLDNYGTPERALNVHFVGNPEGVMSTKQKRANPNMNPEKYRVSVLNHMAKFNNDKQAVASVEFAPE